MSDLLNARLTRKKRVRAYNARGQIYAWLHAHHLDIARCRNLERRPWAVLILEMVADGVRREDGEDPAVTNVARVCERVCRDLEADAKAAKPRRNAPADRPSGWQPQTVPQPSGVPQHPDAAYHPVVAPPPVRSPLRAVATWPQSGPTGVAIQSHDPNMTPEVRAVLDAAFAELEASDRKKFG